MEPNTLTANRVELKKKLLDAAIRKHQTVIDDFRQSIKDISEGIVSDDEMDLSQQEFNTEMYQRSNLIAGQLAFADEEMRFLYDMRPAVAFTHHTVQLGSVVVTDSKTFFISISIGEFEAEGIKCLGLSTKSPLFQAMEGKQKGDRFAYKTNEYRIVDLF